MNQRPNDGMGRVQVEFTVSNYGDVLRAKAGRLPADQVRRVRLKGIVDTSNVRLRLPATVVAQLGLLSAGEVNVGKSWDGIRLLARDAWVELLGRASNFSAIVDNDGSEARIGRIVLAELDLVLDGSTQRLHPRDPDYIISEIE